MSQSFLIFVAFLDVFNLPAQDIKDTRKPNILFIAIDDLKPTIGACEEWIRRSHFKKNLKGLQALFGV